MNRPLAHALATAAAGTVLALAGSAEAQDCTPPRILIVLDASSSMTADIGGITKWEAAIDAVEAVLTEYPQQAEYGFMPFPGPGAGCSTGVVRVEVGPNTGSTITNWMTLNTPPAGGAHTPAGQTLMAASSYGLITDSSYDNYVIFVSDGWQWCSVDTDTHCVTSSDCTLMGVAPCPTCNPGTDGCYCVRSWPELGAEALADAGVTTYVVGFGTSVDALTLNATADIGGTATPNCDPSSSDPSCYFQASQPDELTAALGAIVQQVVTESCVGPCGIEGTRSCELSGWSDCDAPSVVDCMSSCNTPGTQECVGDQLTECSSEVDCGAGGSGGAGNAGNTGGAGNTGNTGGAGNAGNTGGAGNYNPGILEDPEEEGDCGCRLPGKGGRGNALGVVVGVLGLGAIGLRRRNRAR